MDLRGPRMQQRRYYPIIDNIYIGDWHDADESQDSFEVFTVQVVSIYFSHWQPFIILFYDFKHASVDL